jgi:hypothetical protein
MLTRVTAGITAVMPSEIYFGSPADIFNIWFRSPTGFAEWTKHGIATRTRSESSTGIFAGAKSDVWARNRYDISDFVT